MVKNHDDHSAENLNVAEIAPAISVSSNASNASGNSNVSAASAPINSGASAVSSAMSSAVYSSLSQDDISKLVSLHVHQELSRYSSNFGDDTDNYHQHKRLKTVKAKIGKFSSRFDRYPPFCYLISFQDWYEAISKKNKVLKIIGSAGYFSILYPFIVAGIVVGNISTNNPIMTFVFNILAIIPISVVISYLTETLAELTNPTIGSLLNITFGNAIELIFSILALFRGQLDTVQGSMVGSWLATTQLILGCALFFASFNIRQLNLNRLNCYFNVIFMVFSGFIFKMIYSLNYDSNYTSSFKDSTSANPSRSIINLSCGLAILHLFLYIIYLIIPYQHKKLLMKSGSDDLEKNEPVVKFAARNRLEGDADGASVSDSNTAVNSAVNSSIFVNSLGGVPVVSSGASVASVDVEEEQVEQPKLSFWNKFKDIFIYTFFLLSVTVIASFNSDYLLDSLNDFSEETHIPKPFITVILIPIFSNAAEHVTSIVVAFKGHLELALNVAVGSAIQINFFIVPFLVLIARATSSPYTFLFENVYCEMVFAASILASFSILNGKAYFATGSILIMNYVVCGCIVYFMV